MCFTEIHLLQKFTYYGRAQIWLKVWKPSVCEHFMSSSHLGVLFALLWFGLVWFDHAMRLLDEVFGPTLAMLVCFLTPFCFVSPLVPLTVLLPNAPAWGGRRSGNTLPSIGFPHLISFLTSSAYFRSLRCFSPLYVHVRVLCKWQLQRTYCLTVKHIRIIFIV